MENILNFINFSEYQDGEYKELKQGKEPKKCKFMEDSFNSIYNKYIASRLKKAEKAKAKQEEKIYSTTVSPKELQSGKAEKKIMKNAIKLAKLEGEIFLINFGKGFTSNYLQHRALKIGEVIKNSIEYNRDHNYSVNPDKLNEMADVLKTPWKDEEEQKVSEIQKATAEEIGKDVAEIQKATSETEKEDPTKINKNGTSKAKTEKYNDTTYALKREDMLPEHRITIVGSPEQKESTNETTTPDGFYALKKDEMDPELRITHFETPTVSPAIVEDTEKKVAEQPQFGENNNDIFGGVDPKAENKDETENKDTRAMPIVVEERDENIGFDLTDATKQDLENGVKNTDNIAQLQAYLTKAAELKKEAGKQKEAKEKAEKAAEIRKNEANVAKEALIKATETLKTYTEDLAAKNASIADEEKAIQKTAKQYENEKAEYDKAMATIFATIGTETKAPEQIVEKQGRGK